ncbi:MAG: hypothetical protein HFF20_04225 [Oscillospiraceae bacterium]|nr:hypothetical protein [Oscillospiraceae bacterium]MCI9548419.1 hypothetical protein [Oscillospiraceae bacterium]
MRIDVAGQAAVFGQGVLLGALLGLAYDEMRTLRRSLKVPGLAFVLDLMFWLGATAGLFALTLLREDGQVRIYHMAAVALGGGGYFLTLSRLILPALLWLADKIRALLRLLTAPARYLGRRTKKFLENRKKLFQNWLSWYKINILYRFARNGREGAMGNEAETGRRGHKAAGTGDAGRHGHRPAVHPGQAGRRPGRPGRADPSGPGAARGKRRAPGRHRPQRRP